MDESTKATIAKFQAKLDGIEAQGRKIKIAINGLCDLEGEPPMYPDADSDGPSVGPGASSFPIQRSDQFFGRPMATVAREILAWRATKQLGAMSLDDLFSAMVQGGFDFEGKDESTKKRGLASNLGKNPVFARVPSSGHIGLAEWYPNAREKRSKLDTSKEPRFRTEIHVDKHGEPHEVLIMDDVPADDSDQTDEGGTDHQ